MLFVGILLAARSFPQGPLRVLLVRCSNNMLYPKEDKATKCLMQACRNCGHCSPSAEPCVYRNIIKKSTDPT